MVCLGNICRSPIAEAVMAERVARAGLDVVVSSAGTGGWHVGDNADPRALAALRRGGYSLRHSARQFRPDWFDRHELIVAMDRSNQRDLAAMRPGAEVRLLRDWDSQGRGDVPDPYYGGDDAFAAVLEMAERSSEGLIEWLVTTGRVKAAGAVQL